MKKFIITVVLFGSIFGTLKTLAASEKSYGLIQCMPGTKVGLFSSSETEIHGKWVVKTVHFKALPNHIAFTYLSNRNCHHPLDGLEESSMLVLNGRELSCYHYNFESEEGRHVYRFFFQDDRRDNRIYIVVLDKDNIKDSAVAVLDQDM